MLNLKRSICTAVFVCGISIVCCGNVGAQSFEIFGGYQFTHLQSSFNSSGWNAALTKNFKHVLGITGDFSGAYKGERNAHTYTVGPVIQARLPVVQPFAHALFGGITITNPNATIQDDSRSGFAMLIGGGLDIGWRKGLAFRLVQADWISSHIDDVTRNKNVRASTGVVFKF
jgi:hypothetical protein